MADHIQMYNLIILTLSIPISCDYDDWGPIIKPFTPGYMKIVNECRKTDDHACLVIPTKKICRERLLHQPVPWLPPPWWYYYCRWLVEQTPEPTVRTTSTTVHPYFKKMVQDAIKYKKCLKNLEYCE